MKLWKIALVVVGALAVVWIWSIVTRHSLDLESTPCHTARDWATQLNSAAALWKDKNGKEPSGFTDFVTAEGPLPQVCANGIPCTLSVFRAAGVSGDLENVVTKDVVIINRMATYQPIYLWEDGKAKLVTPVPVKINSEHVFICE